MRSDYYKYICAGVEWFKTKHIDLTDNELLERIAKDGSQEWSTALFSRYVEMIYGVCMKYYKNPSDSKDATMDIYEKFCTKVKTHNIEYFKSWLYTLVKNHCLEKLRKSNRDREKFNAIPLVQSEDFFHPFSEDQKELVLIKLEECMTKLKEEQRVCIDLFYLQKKSYEEIVDTLKLEWKRVRSLIQNGRRNLKICLEKE